MNKLKKIIITSLTSWHWISDLEKEYFFPYPKKIEFIECGGTCRDTSIVKYTWNNVIDNLLTHQKDFYRDGAYYS